MFTVGCDRDLRINSAYILMFNLAMSDILISTLVHTFTNIGIIKMVYFLVLNYFKREINEDSKSVLFNHKVFPTIIPRY